ncbi:Urocanate hydratase [Geodia barretti]|uniref:Urocanate hydratase n=1 Tax=Geodia barretti TaxID=519541 RepID=A0AA35SKA3_GEOBA|nr:Urocanate hydratase [Geodia barretti]
MSSLSLADLCSGLPLDPLPPAQTTRDPSVSHAPPKMPSLDEKETKLALKNALRYFPAPLHSTLGPEFARELKQYGHIYMYRFRPHFDMRAYPIQDYPCRIPQAAAMMIMIMNNLDPNVAQFPHELVTYGGNGQVLSNWAQFWLLMNYLSRLDDDQTLVMVSGHPQGLFPSHKWAPRCVISNGMVVPNYSSKEEYEKMFAKGVSMYGQMTAGSYCYIGPQGIVHGTTLTLMNAGREYLKLGDLSGKVFLTSGLGGMSGAQAKASAVAGCVGVIAEVSKEALLKRHKQGWLMEWTDNLDDCIARIKRAKQEKKAVSLGYLGNVVDLWERVVVDYEATGELLVELGSDQTSLHNPFGGGYYPVQLGFDEALQVMKDEPPRFKHLVQESLKRHVDAINKLAEAGMHFWDYGNAFLLEASRAGADVRAGASATVFRYPSYVQDIMGDLFSLGFGPFRWVCASGLPEDLSTTDNIALETMEELSKNGKKTAPPLL